MLLTITILTEIQHYTQQARKQNKTIGLVPTMGALHEGHLSLIKKAKEQCDIVIVSIFVNPTQFAPNEDFTQYPRNLEQDTKLAKSAGATILFTPTAEEIYPKEYSTYITLENLSTIYEGKIRPTHFRGVATIVAKLFFLTQPHKAFFGQKDAQQCAVIKKMVEDLHLPIEIIIAPIIREKDGLAKSSRNIYLSPQERKDSTILYQSLELAKSLIEKGEIDTKHLQQEIQKNILTKKNVEIDYIAFVHPTTFQEIHTIQKNIPTILILAVRFGKTRLLDNIVIIA